MNKPDACPAIQDRYLDHHYALAGRIVDPITGYVGWQGKRVHLQRKDLEVLALLASNQGAIITRANFIAVVWNGNDLVGDRGVSDKIFSLRKALADHDEQQPLIRTIPRRGYQLTVTAVQPVMPEQPAFIVGGAIPGCPGWRLQRRLSESLETESWLSQSDDRQIAPRVFSFCQSEAQLRRFKRETTLLRYLSETLGERADIALIRDWQLLEPPYFLARDYCTHANLTEWANAVGGLPAQSQAQREALMVALAVAVASVHAIGIVHGQLSAASVLFDDDDGDAGPQLKLSAFDLGALSDRNKLVPHEITDAGLSFIEGMHAPTIAGDIQALGALLLQLALGDLNAQPNEAALLRITEEHWRALISSCFTANAQQPSAAELALGLRKAAGADAMPTNEIPPLSPLPASPNTRTMPEQQIGPYRLFEKLGQGGMGVVYLAEQREPVQRHVALKVILAGMDTNEVLARFEAERQALALMNHVNIAAVFDAGSSAAGRPYFAMEYVPGLEITAHCDERELDFRQRIELFLQVCDGVLHAHQKGIIHRDLKPSNILIKTAQGQAATAKIIDFGVAKSLQRKLGSLTAHTQLGSFVGTRTYSSPEQISGNIVALDTRTDTYSLGVVLYELLAGVTPYDEEVLAAKSPIALSKLISQEEPPPLLKRFISLGAQVESDIATRRKLTVAQMKQTLSSDLAWIVAKCLERDPNARYASVLELKKDLGRWLENRPVEARPITWHYRMRKMVRRNWAAVILGSVVTLAFVLTGTAAVAGFLRSERALAEAELAADFQVKQIKAIDPAKMGNTLREILMAELTPGAAAENDPVTSRLAGLNMTDVTLKQLDAMYFDPAFAAIEKDFDNAPLLQARLMQSLGENLQEVGRYEKAKQVLETVLAQRSRLLGSQHPLTLETLLSRGKAHEGLGMNRLAEADYRAALASLRKQLGVQNPQTILVMQTLGRLLLSEWRDIEAYELLEETARASRLAFGDKDERTLAVINLYAIAAIRSGRIDEAEKLAREALAGLIALHGKVHEQSLFALQTVANVVDERGSSELAETYLREVFQGAEQLFGRKHHFTLAARHNLASAIEKNGRVTEAIGMHREVQRDLHEIFGANHPSTLTCQIQFGGTLLDAGQFAEAKQVLDSALQLIQGSENDFGTLMFDAIYQLGLLAKKQGQFDEAERLLKQSLEGRQLFGENHTDTMAAQKALEELKAERSASTLK